MPDDEKYKQAVKAKFTAIVICIGDRYFVRFGKRGLLITAWSLAGAKLFGLWKRKELEAVETKLNQKKKEYQLIEICGLRSHYRS